MMQPNRSLHVVFGATGAIGSAVVGELLRRGHSARAVSRRGQAPKGAQGAAADASDPAVIYHCASPPYTKWPELFPALTRSILGAAESSGAKLVFADNLYAYGPAGGALREDLPPNARGRKGQTRAEMAGQLLGAYRDGRARIVIGRASDYYGPRGTGSIAGETLFGRILAGKKPPWTGKLDQPHTFCFLPDIARGLLLLADRPAADGQIWHLPAAGPLTARQFSGMVAEAAGKPVPAGRASPGRRCSRSRASSRRCSGRCARRPASSGRPSLSTRQARSRLRPPRAHSAPRRREANTRVVPLPPTRRAARRRRTGTRSS